MTKLQSTETIVSRIKAVKKVITVKIKMRLMIKTMVILIPTVRVFGQMLRTYSTQSK